MLQAVAEISTGQVQQSSQGEGKKKTLQRE